jgi:chorismate mutase
MNDDLASYFCNRMTPAVSLTSWGFPDARPIIISGPCSAETPDQVMATALALKESGVHALRAGIWKPRTRPGSFQGMGEEALVWLKNAGTVTGLPVMVEVASPLHVEQALKSGIDMLWIGARTTVNPFLVQEIAEALSGIDIPILVKNPVNPDTDLWQGAIERFFNVGISRVGAVHRGFSAYENSTYRNKPNWEIPIELRRRLPGIPMFCDPSHICGNTYMIPYVAQFAMDLQYEGLMVEAHINPEDALSDAKQQLTPVELREMLDYLIIRKANAETIEELSRLEDLRDQIDELDAEIVHRLAERMHVARKIGRYKYHNNIAILQPERWNEIIASRTNKGVELELTHEFVQKLYGIIHEESIHQQTKQMNEEKNIENAGSSLNEPAS